MAKLKYPALSGVASGKLADIVFFRRGDFGINVARMRVIPANPRTAKQQALRNNIKVLSGIWAGTVDLSAGEGKLYKYNGTTWTQITIATTETFGTSEKQAWEAYTTTSKTGGYKVKGRLAFLSVNMRRLYSNQDPLKTPTTEFTLQS